MTAKYEGGYIVTNTPYFVSGRPGDDYAKYKGTSPDILEPCDDAAVAYGKGEGWRMPTADDFKTLCAACGKAITDMYTSPTATISADQEAYAKGIYWVTGGGKAVKIAGDEYKVNGMLFVQDADTHVFFPACGYIGADDGMTYGTRLSNAGTVGYYWSSTHSIGSYDFAHRLRLAADVVNPGDHGDHRHLGFSIRPVKDLSYLTNSGASGTEDYNKTDVPEE